MEGSPVPRLSKSSGRSAGCSIPVPWASHGTATPGPPSFASIARPARPVSSGSLTLSPELRPRSGKGGYPIRWRSAWLTACSGVLAIAVAGCGGNGTETDAEAPGPRIERAVAEQLAGLSDELAGSLESGDSCAAAQTAAQLRDSVTQAIADRKVPRVYLEDLSGLANELQLQTPECVEPAPPSDEDDGKEKKKQKDEDKSKDKRDKKDKKDKGGEETVSIPTEPDTTTTVTATTETTQTEPTTTTGTTTSSEEDR